MRQTQLFGKTSRMPPADEVSLNAQLLVRAGYVDKLMAGVYTFMPLGLRVLKRIEDIIRDELNALGSQEMLMPALHPKASWERTGRWDNPGREVMFQITGRGDREYGLGWTHEEVITPLAKKLISSYKDLPLSVYQIQTKFRDEPRAKSGLLRGREFIMKDLYSFHIDENDLADYYQIVLGAYQRIFERVGVNARVVEASGGAFSKYSHEFQVLTPAGEDIIIFCGSCDFAQNREIAKESDGDRCTKCKASRIEAARAIEVGNIFKLKDRFSRAFNLMYRDEAGREKFAQMGCYGIGLGRTLGAIVEVNHDDSGICWPVSVAPYLVHLLALGGGVEAQRSANAIYASLQKAGIGVLYDDRKEISAGEKFADADLIGIPIRAVVSEKTLPSKQVEIKKRVEKQITLISIKDIIKHISAAYAQ